MFALLDKSINYSKADIAGVILLSVIWGERLLYYVRSVLLRLPIIGKFAEPFIAITIIAVILFTYRYVRLKIQPRDVFFLFVVGAIYLSHMLFFPANEKFLSDKAADYFLMVLPFFLLGVVCDIDKCIGLLEKISLAYIILGVLYFYYVSSVVETYEMDTTVDQMGIAYQYLPHVLLVLYSLLKKFNILYLIGFLLGTFMIIGTGNRGSLLLIAVFLLFFFLFSGEKLVSWGRIILVGVIAIALLNMGSLMNLLYIVLDDMGLSVRSLIFLMDNNFMDDNGRDAVQTNLYIAMQNSPLLGYGLCGDRVINGDYGDFAHNLYIEMIISFGPFLGLLIFSSILVLLFLGFRNAKSNNQRFFFLLLFCCGFLKLFLSSSFMGERLFYMLLGFSVALIRSHKKDSNHHEHIDNRRILGVC